MQSVAYEYQNFSEGEESREGRWAGGASKDGKGEFTYVAKPGPITSEEQGLKEADPRLYGTPKQPIKPTSA